MSMKNVLVKVNEDCYIRYPRDGGKSYGGNWANEIMPDGKSKRTWKGAQFECPRTFAEDINTKPRPIVTIIADIEEPLPVIKSTEPVTSPTIKKSSKESVTK